MRFFSRHILWFAALGGIAACLFMGRIFYEQESKAIALDFKKDVDDKAAALEREMLLNLEALYVMKGIFERVQGLSSTDFRRLSESIFVRHRNIQALEWIPRVRQPEREAFEAERRRDYPDFEITQRTDQGRMARANDRSVYFPVSYVEPFLGNELALGFDLAQNPKRLKTLEKSRDLGVLLATESITLVQDSSHQQGVLFFMPVYEGNPVTLKKRREKLWGFVLGVFRIADIFKSAANRIAANGINLSLVDVSDGAATLLHANHASDKATTETNITFRYRRTLTSFGGRQWAVIGTPTAGYVAARRSLLPIASAAFGILFVLLGTAYSYIFVRRSVLIEHTVARRTRDLNETKKKLEALSRTDGLTQIPNRRFFDTQLEAEWKRAVREKASLTLLMIDIDYFKLFNDTYGHAEGDKCLKAVAKALQDALNRSSDFVARYGGEEFAIVLPDTESAFAPAETCRSNVEGLKIPHENSKTSSFVTVSIGVVTTVPETHSGLLAFIHKADRGLYEAKARGRNCVCAAA